ncbi:MAG: hypothetical protein MZV65_53965 [Chromatiales bacterium]|nr:hypothetical protein [Chromatiales bacterium]
MGHFLKVSLKEPVYFDPGPAVAAVTGSPDIQAKARGYDLSVRVDPCPPEILCDPTSFGEVVRNLLDNAFDATPAGRGGRRPGLPEEPDRVHRFGPRQRPGDQQPGQGPALPPLLHHQGEGHGPRPALHQAGHGHLRRQDRRPEPGGEGDHLQADLQLPRKGAESMKKKILLVEDEKALCLLYEEELSRDGYEVIAVQRRRGGPGRDRPDTPST